MRPDEIEPERSKEGVNLDELQDEAERLLALLKDRQTGLWSWNNAFAQRLRKLHALTSEALKQ